MLKPSVGSIVSMDSPQNLRRMVVLPALSRPRMRMRTSFSFSLTLTVFEMMMVVVSEWW